MAFFSLRDFPEAMPPFRAISRCSLFVRLFCGFRFSSFIALPPFHFSYPKCNTKGTCYCKCPVAFDFYPISIIRFARFGSYFNICANSLIISHSSSYARSCRCFRVPSCFVIPFGRPAPLRAPPHPSCSLMIKLPSQVIRPICQEHAECRSIQPYHPVYI